MDSDRQPRGEGFELRTDSWGAIRAQKGIFISADGQVQAQGQVLAMEPAVSLLKGAVNQVTEWGSITQTHHNVIPDTGPLSALTTGASDLKQPTLLMSAPQGIAAVTPETTLLHSGKGLYLQSLGRGQHHHGTALFSECQPGYFTAGATGGDEAGLRQRSAASRVARRYSIADRAKRYHRPVNPGASAVDG